LTFDLLTLKVVPESRVTWATSVPILVFLDLGPMYATDKRQTASLFNASSLWRRGHNNATYQRPGIDIYMFKNKTKSSIGPLQQAIEIPSTKIFVSP